MSETLVQLQRASSAHEAVALLLAVATALVGLGAVTRGRQRRAGDALASLGACVALGVAVFLGALLVAR